MTRTSFEIKNLDEISEEDKISLITSFKIQASKDIKEHAITDEGYLFDSGEFNLFSSANAKKKITEIAEQE